MTGPTFSARQKSRVSNASNNLIKCRAAFSYRAKIYKQLQFGTLKLLHYIHSLVYVYNGVNQVTIQLYLNIKKAFCTAFRKRKRKEVVTNAVLAI
jgi:hypothetical protein